MLRFPKPAVRPPAIAILTFAVVVLAAALTPANAIAQEVTPQPTRLIPINNVNWVSAQKLAENVCSAARTAWQQSERNSTMPCVSVDVVDGNLAVSASETVLARIEELITELNKLPETHEFQIVVLSASATGGIDTAIPSNVQSALEDVRSFLPYTGFSVLGTGWLRTSREGRTTLSGESGLQATLGFRSKTDATSPILVEDFSIFRTEPREVVSDGTVTMQMGRVNMLQSTFTIDPGESVVVGTSKLNGDETAVVVLLTAVRD